ncbi:Putative peptidase [Ignavibacterium album JCM 16511]|uniref:Putative peptidase n=1 Tax=Ignavibacterium album (strain DSM 19864 / JCM 16511 / NBRC 101810 / Mat9-16) TaxID=945713 RepID=I0AIT8_IGNAJ|nr:prolyl oligopeptidase family serine peptidase [Ignavibacterium album]AFH48895.1 Putative peptidase [Ignavibacterium album JCM 16511]
MKYFLIIIIITFFMTESFSQDKSGRQEKYKLEKEIKLKVELQYLIYLPPDYKTSEKNYPLVLFLHGAGERGTDIELVKRNGPPKLVEEGEEFPFILVSPQCPEGTRWNYQTQSLITLLDEIESKFRVDKNRIYVTGLSMGGQGTWTLALSQPNRFAAIAPVCGWTDSWEVCKISHLPVWVFHGAKDNVVPVSESEEMVNALKECGASEVKLTIYPEANHDAWTETYNNEELYNWLLSHSLQNK